MRSPRPFRRSSSLRQSTETVEYLTDRWRRYTGQAVTDALGTGYAQHVHPEERDDLAARWATLRAAGQEGSAEIRLRRFDGCYRRHRITVAPYRAGGTVARWIGTLTDVHVERSAERSFRTLAETVPAMVWAARPDGYVDYYNTRWGERVADVAQLLGEGWAQIVHPDDLASTAGAWMHSIASGDAYFNRARIRMRDGAYRRHEATATAERDEAGEIVRWYGACVDVHESVILRDELRNQDVVTRLLRELARRTPSLLFTIAADGRVDFINERWSEVIGVDADRMLGDGWRHFVHADDVPKHAEILREHARTGAPYIGEWRFKRTDDAYRWIEIRAEAQDDDDGRIVRWYGTGIDINTRRRAIDALELLAESGAGAATASDVDTTLARVADASLAGVADMSLFDLVESDGTTRRVAIAAPGIPDSALAAIRLHPTPASDAAHPISRAMGDRNCIHIPVVDEAYLAAHIEPEERREAWRTTGIRSVVIAPLLVGGKTLGSLTLLRTRTSVPFDRQDVRVVEEIARRTAVALENLRLRELARAESAERDERFRRIADAIPQLMWVAQSDGRVEWVNERWLHFTGQTFEAALADGWRDIIHPDDEAGAHATWRAAGERGAVYECEFRLRESTGAYRWFLGRAAPVETIGGRRWYGTNTDIDDARRASRTLRVFADVGEALSESLGLQATLDAVMQVVVPEFADWAFITLVDEESDLRVAAIYHSDRRRAHRSRRRSANATHGAASRRDRPPPCVPRADPLPAQRRTPTPHASSKPDVLDVFWRRSGFDSVLIIPLIVGATVRGTLTVCMSRVGANSTRTMTAVLPRTRAAHLARDRERRSLRARAPRRAIVSRGRAAGGAAERRRLRVHGDLRGRPCGGARRRRLVRRVHARGRPHRHLHRRRRRLGTRGRPSRWRTCAKRYAASPTSTPIRN